VGDDRRLVMRERVAVATGPGDGVRGGTLRDDGPGSDDIGGDVIGGDGDLRLTLTAIAAELGPMRRSLVEWARGRTTDESTVADLQLAVGEAVANGVEHA